MSDEKPTINVVSHNQSGGITAGIVNLGPRRLEFSDELARKLVNSIAPIKKPVKIECIRLSFHDEITGKQFMDYLKNSGIQVLDFETIAMSIGAPPGQLKFVVCHDHIMLYINPSYYGPQ